MDGELPDDPMWDLEDELREYVDEQVGVTKTDIDGDRAYVLLVDTEDKAEELTAMDVEAADGTKIIEMPSIANHDYGAAFKVDEE